MAKKHVFNIGPVRGVGASAKAAKDDAIVTAASILGSDHTPVLVQYRDETRLAVRDEYGTWSIWRGSGPQVPRCGPNETMPAERTWLQVRRALTLDVAKVDWDLKAWRQGELDWKTYTHDLLVTDPAAAEEFRGWLAFQLAYDWYRGKLLEKGMPEHQAANLAHSVAGGMLSAAYLGVDSWPERRDA